MATNPRTSYLLGVALSAGGVVVISPEGLMIRLSDGASLWDAAFFRNLFMGLALLIALAVRHGAALPAAIVGMGRAGLLVMPLMAVTHVGIVGAVTHTSIANTFVLIATTPLFAALFGRLFIGEPVRPRTWGAIAAAFAGIVVIFANSLGQGFWVGDVMACVTAATQGLVVVVLRGARIADIMPPLGVSALMAALCVLPFADPLAVPGGDIATLALLGGVFLATGFTLFYSGVRYVPAAEVTLLVLLETPLAPLWAWLGIGEVPAPTTLWGGAVIVAAIAINSALALRRPAPG